VEALRNICGATLLRPGYADYEEFNLRKFQAKHSKKPSQAESSLLVHAPVAIAEKAEATEEEEEEKKDPKTN
jgi:hypothetical protein